MTLRTTKQLPSIRSTALPAAARLKQAATAQTAPARPQRPASRDTFELKTPKKAGPQLQLSGTHLNAAASLQLKTAATVAHANPLLTQARLAALGGKGILGTLGLPGTRFNSLDGAPTARRGDAQTAAELYRQQALEASNAGGAYGADEVYAALGPDSPLTQAQKDEYIALLATEHPELLTQSAELPYTDGATVVYGPETQKLIADAIAHAHEAGVLSDAELRETASTFENPTEFALLLALGDDTGEVGGPLDVVGQYYQQQAGRTDDPEAASRYRVATALAFTSSEALIAERLPTEEARVKAFSTVALQIDEQFQGGIYPSAEALNAAAQDQFAENATRLFGLAGEEIARNLATTTDSPFNSESAPRGTDILAQFFAGTLLSPRGSELQVDGRPASEVLTRGFEAAYNYLWSQAESLPPGSGSQNEAFQKVGVFLGAVDIAAERVERQELEPEEESKALKLLADVLLDAVKLPPGVGPIAEALLDQVLNPDSNNTVNPSIENFAQQYIQAYLDRVSDYEDLHPETEATNSVENGYQETQIEDQQDSDG
ncbi:hypothetical protein [Archangium lipolyticum]|uniref:hypothetical protein n=1 Tax=Archangium lipolyticum TaxID=2970465 RepID=UPI002149A30C|nr:hypothetical protein [Archangium lipolyticum]